MNLEFLVLMSFFGSLVLSLGGVIMIYYELSIGRTGEATFEGRRCLSNYQIALEKIKGGLPCIIFVTVIAAFLIGMLVDETAGLLFPIGAAHMLTIAIVGVETNLRISVLETIEKKRMRPSAARIEKLEITGKIGVAVIAQAFALFDLSLVIVLTRGVFLSGNYSVSNIVARIIAIELGALCVLILMRPNYPLATTATVLYMVTLAVTAVPIMSTVIQNQFGSLVETSEGTLETMATFPLFLLLASGVATLLVARCRITSLETSATRHLEPTRSVAMIMTLGTVTFLVFGISYCLFEPIETPESFQFGWMSPGVAVLCGVAEVIILRALEPSKPGFLKIAGVTALLYADAVFATGVYGDWLMLTMFPFIGILKVYRRYSADPCASSKI